MIVESRLRLDHLTKEEMWSVVLDQANDPAVQNEALERWLAMDDQDRKDSIKRMQRLLEQMRNSRFGLPEKSQQTNEQSDEKAA